MKQSQALDILKTGYSVFLTGQAGAGKTYVLNQYIHHLREHGIAVAITASTGIAATHMNGMTIHSWSGIGIKDSFEKKDFARLAKKEALTDRLTQVRVLIIDEVSMLHARQLDLVDEVLRHFRKDERPFGGIQVVFSGDFFQLPPIGKKEETTKDKFAFMSKAWIALATNKQNTSTTLKVCYLSEQHRQTEETSSSLSLNDILNQIRTQQVSQEAIDLLNATRTNAIDVNRTRLFTHNAKVDDINDTELDALDGQAHEYTAYTFGDDDLIDTLKKNVRAPEVLTLKLDAKVMFVKNNPETGVFNGTMGKVVNFVRIVHEDGTQDTLPEVLLNSGRKLIVTYDNWSIDDEDGVALASYSQLPLCLAWAITVHKSQGMTLDAAEVDLSKTFEKGQGYVALSRIKTLQGLKLLGLNHTSLLLDDFAQAANRRFLALSKESEHWLDALGDTALAQLHTQFIHANALLYESNKSPTQKPKSNKPTPSAHTSQEATLALIQEQKSLDEMAQARNLSKSTIVGHIEQLIKTDKLTSAQLSYLAPDKKTLQAVDDALHHLFDTGELEDVLKLRPIYDELREEVSYLDIRLALLFLYTTFLDN